jgi:molybdate transport system regulatory protein
MPPRTTFKFRIRIERGGDVALGPGKVALLEAIVETGSITAAATMLGMSYRRAWLLVDATNRCFRTPVVGTRRGGKLRGGAAVTPLGLKVIARYRAIEAMSTRAAAAEIAALLHMLRK